MAFALPVWPPPFDSLTLSLTLWRGSSAGGLREGHLLSQGAEEEEEEEGLDLCEGLAFGFPPCSVVLREDKGLRM